MAGTFSDIPDRPDTDPAPKGVWADLPPPEKPSMFQTSMQTVGDMFSGAKRGMESIAEGTAQSALQLGSLVGIDSKAPQDALERLRAERIGEYQPSADRSPVASGIGEFAGGATAGAIAAGAATAAGAAAGTPALITSTAGKAAAAILGSGASSAAMTYGTPEEKAIAGGIGATLGGLGQAVKARGAVAKALVGNVDDVKARVDNAGKLGQTLTVGQALDSPSIQTVEKGLAEVPIVGTKGAFNRQLAGAKDASTKVVEGLNTVSKESVDDAYKAFGDLAAASEKPVPLSNLQNAVTDLKAKLRIGNTEFKGMTATRLKGFVDQLPAEQELKPTEITKLQEMFGNVFDGIKETDKSSLKNASALKKAFETDLESYAKANSPELSKAFTTAKGLHESRMNGEALQKMLDGAIDKKSGKLDPNAFTVSLARNNKMLKEKLPPKDYKVVKGLQTYLQSVNQGVAVGKSNSFGLKSLILGAVGSLGYFNPTQALVGGAATKAASAALTSPKTTDLLLKLASAKPGSPVSGAIKRAITRGLTVETAKQAVED